MNNVQTPVTGQSVCIIPSVSSKANICNHYGTIFGKTVSCFCDTGTTVSVINEDLLKTLKEANSIKISDCKPEFMVLAVNGNPLPVVGKATLPFKLGSRKFCQEFYIIKISSNLILGLDFLSKQKAIIDCGTGLLQIKGQAIPLNISNSAKYEPGKLKLSAELDPFSGTLLMVRIDHPNPSIKDGKLGLVISKLPTRWRALGGKVLSEIKNGEVPMLIINLSDKKISIFKETALGQFEQLNAHDLKTLDKG